MCVGKRLCINGDLRHTQGSQPILGALLGVFQDFTPLNNF